MTEVVDRVFLEGEGERRALTPESLPDIWSKTYNTDGKPDWSHLYPYYHPDIIFQDSIQKLEGFERFTDMCNRLAKRCKQLHFDIHDIVQDENIIMMEWTMTMTFRKTPMTPIRGATKLTLHEDGRILRQRDYYDLWGDIFDGVRGFRFLYRGFMSKVFG